MSYALEEGLHGELTRPVEGFPEMERIEVEFRSDHYGEDALFFRVVLKDGASGRHGAAVRLEEIASALRARAMERGLPFSFVHFVDASDAS